LGFLPQVARASVRQSRPACAIDDHPIAEAGASQCWKPAPMEIAA
jgi:hypothetical protein